MANFSLPEAKLLAFKIFTGQEFEVLNGRTLQRAFEGKTHCVNVLALDNTCLCVSMSLTLPLHVPIFGARALSPTSCITCA